MVSYIHIKLEITGNYCMKLNEYYKKCTLCPRACKADRTSSTVGACGMGANLTAARASLHMWEEPPISGERGSGTVFFSGCSLSCVFCQNAEISHGGEGKVIDCLRLAEIFLELEQKGAHNINLVTASHFVPHVISALDIAKEMGLSVPVLYNCGGYEKADTIRSLSGKIDIYLPDLKYADNALAKALSGISDYFEVATAAIREMVAQVGPVQWRDDKVVKGVIIRHLILPGNVENSLKVLDWIGEAFAPGEVLVSLMRQYTPMGSLGAPMDRPITDEEYDSVLSWMYLNDLQGFTQEESSADTTYIPDF